MSKIQSKKLIEIKISTVVAVSAILHDVDPVRLDAAMHDMTGGSSDYFDGELVVIDVGDCDTSNKAIDWAALIRLFKSYHLNPVAVRNAAPEIAPDILAHGLSLDVIAKPRQQTEEPEIVEITAPVVAPIAAAPEAPAHSVTTMIIDTPVRAGQRVYARGADLIVTAIVNNGAELIADGSIHVYAPLRGRALAGASGNAAARIFALSMEAELVSIAGVYQTFESGLKPEIKQHAVQISLAGDRIDVQTINR
ncbi:MAG: septum site-determining protein MinC [Burkholderiaceae bacterium]